MNVRATLVLPLAAAAALSPVIAGQSAQSAEASSEYTITAYTTGYTWFDNTPVGSAEIAHPVLHQRAGGTGTYANPITLATASGRFKAGTRFYIPNMHRYFIAEDIGGGNMSNPPAGASAWLDLWIGGAGGSARGADNCSSAITANHKVIVNPGPGYAVQAGTIYNGTCHGNFGERVSHGGTTLSRHVVRKAVSKPRAVAAHKPAAKQAASKPAAHHAAYVVRAGDTLSKIARQHHTTWQKLFQLNRGTLKNPNMLLIGQKLVLA